ncbi:MAG TPA: portal protein [Bryobacteraceae bacterium]|nr:portal protein [Bryobacteraceae bacterium]
MEPPYIPSEDLDRSLAPAQSSRSKKKSKVIVSAKKKEEVIRDPNEDLLKQARDRFTKAAQHDQKWRELATEELDFVDGLEHWSQEMRQDRKGVPCLTFDRIGPSIDQVVNDARQDPPEPKVSPVGGGADKETAEILEGLYRNIANDSNGKIAFMTGYEHAVKIGRGWWRVNKVYESEEDFVQKLVIRRIKNPFSVYPDPAADEFDYSDMNYCFVTEDLDPDLFKQLYPDALATGMADWQAQGDRIKQDWYPESNIRVAEYWYVERTKKTLYLLDDGRKVTSLDQKGEGTQVLAQREVYLPKVQWAKMTGMEILEQGTWEGKWIPIIPVIGREVIMKQRTTMRGMIRPAMDANLSYDLMRSKQVETIGLAPLSPYLAAAAAIEGHEYIWADANRKRIGYLPWNHMDDQGNPIPKPERNLSEPPIQAVTMAVAAADNDVKATLATFDASLGNDSPESSGRAILARQREGDNAHFHYHDNLRRSVEHTGRVIVDLIPHVYREERTINIFDPDGSQRAVQINAQKITEGADRIYKLNNPVARFDAVVGNDPSYATRRLQASAQLMELFRAAPQVLVRAIDLIIRTLDLPDGDEIADRLRPPDVQTDAKDIPPQVQAMVAKLQGIIQAQGVQIQTLKGIIDKKILELESKERQTTETNLTRVLVAEVSGKSAEAQKLAELDHQSVKHRLDLAADREQQQQQNQPGQQPAQAQPETAGAATNPQEEPEPVAQ